MTIVLTAARTGLRRGLIEFRNVLTTASELTYSLLAVVGFGVVLFLIRDQEMSGLPYGLVILPGALAVIVVFVAAYNIATVVTGDREDGGLLRSAAVPHGLVGYVTGQILRGVLETAFMLVLILIAATLLIDGVWLNGAAGIAAMAGLLLLGTLACLPIGLAVGSAFANVRRVGSWGFLVAGGLIAVSGLLMPLALLPGWAQLVGQVFPPYWIGLGLRSALLPDTAVVAEVGGSWRQLETVSVLGAWAIIGLVLAPILLQKMARRESGSGVAARREMTLKRG